jgi:CRISPR/Cas system CSM-associated protein Csm4 (group 5 of RAMP superfamily)
MIAIQETANHFENLVQSHKYEEASSLLADDFLFRSPMHNFQGKKDWLKKFPKAHKNIPIIPFGDFEKSQNGSNQIERRGKKKVAFVTVTVKQVIEVDEHGKIKSIIASKE